MKKYTVEKRKIPSTGRDIKILIFRPTTAKKALAQTPGVLWIHGGGYATGMAEMAYFSRPLALVKKYGAVVVCVSYRLSIESPYPAALEDCHSALCWLKEHAAELGINDSQIMVGGESAGGGLTAALCMYARDKSSVNIAYQMPLYPMLDDRDTESSQDNHAAYLEHQTQPCRVEAVSERPHGDSVVRSSRTTDGLFQYASGLHLCGRH